MGLDIVFIKPIGEYGFRAGSYTWFHIFRSVLAAEEGINLGQMDGFGGGKLWERETPLHDFLAHSDCDDVLYHHQVENAIPRVREILNAWRDGNFAYSKMFPNKEPLTQQQKDELVQSLEEWLSAFERIVDNYNKNDLIEYIQFA